MAELFYLIAWGVRLVCVHQLFIQSFQSPDRPPSPAPSSLRQSNLQNEIRLCIRFDTFPFSVHE